MPVGSVRIFISAHGFSNATRPLDPGFDAMYLVSVQWRQKKNALIVDPGTGGVLSSIRNRNNTQEPDSETRDRRTRAESDKQEQADNKSDSERTIRERNNPRKNNFSTNTGNFPEHYIFLTQNR